MFSAGVQSNTYGVNPYGKHAITTVVSFHHLQLIYDVQDGGGSIGLISTAPHMLTELRKIGVEIPTMV